MRRKKLRNTILLCSLFLLLLVSGITFLLLPNTFSNFVTIENVWSGEVATSFSGGNGTEANPYQIARGEELAYFKQVIEGEDSDSYINQYYVLTEDINMGNLSLGPIGKENKIFCGHFDGQGYTISNLKITDATTVSGTPLVGLFSKLDHATVTNLNLNEIMVGTAYKDQLQVGLLAGRIENESTLSNLSFSNNQIDVTGTMNGTTAIIGTVSGTLNNSQLKNAFIQSTFSDATASFSYAIASYESDSIFENIIIDTNASNGVIEEPTIYRMDQIPEDFVAVLNQEINSEDFYWENNNGYHLVRKVIMHMQAINPVRISSFTLHDSGISDNIVYVNDLESDYYYYKGLNYTSNNNDRLPTMDNKNIYTDQNLANVQITYRSSYTRNGENLHATVSTTELQDTYVYYKVFVVNDNGTAALTDDYIMIELIDNPFTNRPKDYGFNGWQTAYRGAEISYDDTYYIRYAKVPVTYSNGIPNDIVINFNAMWTEADVRFSTSNSTANLTNAINAFKDKSMQQRATTKTVQEPIYGTVEDNVMDGYYIQDTVAYNTEYPSGSYSNTGADLAIKTGTVTARNGLVIRNGAGTTYRRLTAATYGSTVTVHEYSTSGNGCNDRWVRVTYGSTTGYACSTYVNVTIPKCTTSGGCTVYQSQEGTTYDASKTYYHLVNGRMTELDPSTLDQNPIIGYNDVTYDLFSATDNMSGYYEQVTLSRNQSLNGYYDNVGILHTSGTCTSASCTYYKLIQYYDENGNPNTYREDKNYYYLVTRDTNLIILQAALSGAWANNQTKPLTITSSYGGTLYNVRWTLSNTYVKANDDLGLENLTIYSGQAPREAYPSSGTATSRMFYGNWQNVKIGRGIKHTATNQVNFDSVIGGSNTATGSQSNLTKYRIIVESGYYSTTSQTCGSTTSSPNVYIHGEVIYGNDYDRVSNNNNNLDVYYTTSGSWGCYIRGATSTDKALNQTFKSGKFGSRRPTTIPADNDTNNFTYGVYVGGRSYGRTYVIRTATVEGGWIYNLIGGPLVDSNISEYNSVQIYMKGGEVDAIYGGAGVTETYGNRIIQVTGGQVNYSVFGGSNGITGDDSEGTLTGSPYIYIGGNAVIGNQEYVQNNRTLFGFEAGSVFGIGNGKEKKSSIGSANNSYITIDENATILKNVYGGGNYGAVGSSSSSNRSESIINIHSGSILGNVYGGGNRNGSGSTTKTASVTINFEKGTINGSIYGGSNETGTIYGDVTINHSGGSVLNDIYGGGYGGASNSSTGTYVSGNINVNIGSQNGLDPPVIEGSVYGGSAFGTVNGTSHTTNVSNSNVNVVVNNGTIKHSVFGGGKGNSTYTPYVLGDITVSINDGNIVDVFGGNDAAGTPNGTVTVYLNGGYVNRTFGGGNNASVHTNYVYLQGGTSNLIFGGSNAGGTVTTSNVIVQSGTTETVYGGNNTAGNTVTSNVTIKGGNISEAVYGGGSLATTGETHVTLDGSTIPDVFGGGENADVTGTTHVVQNSATVTNIYGGSNAGGSINQSDVTINGGVSTNVFGGNNADGITKTTHILMNNGTVDTIYGGGNQIGVTTSNIDLVNGSINQAVYGGSNQNGDVTNTHIKTLENVNPDLKIVDVYGGNNLGGTTYQTEVVLNKGHYDNVFGGGNRAEVTGDTTLTLQDVTVTNSVYGGGNEASVLGNPTVHIYGTSSVGKSVFGGGNHGSIGTENGDSVVKVHLAGATVGGNVYGGCNTSVVNGVTEVYIGKSALNEHEGVVAGDIVVTGTIFGGGEANENGSENYDYNFISVTKGITILIDGTGYGTNGYDFTVTGSIFGSGNASSSAGPSTIYIRKLGTRSEPDKAVSIQRADEVTLDSSALELVGTTDRTNEYSSIKYSLNRIKKFTIKNNSTLLLQENANMLESFYSVTDQDEKAKVTIDDDSKTVTRNVDNRLYLLAGNNLNVTTNENATAYGIVSGMTFMGMYQTYSNGTYVYGMYDESKGYGDSATVADLIPGGSYVLGLHQENHDITVDGFYTNYIDDAYTTLTTAYIDPTPPDSIFYRWIIGTSTVNYSINLTASKYSSLGTYELSLKDFTVGNTIFNVIGFNADGLSEGIILKEGVEVPRLASTPEEANQVLGLTMRAETIEWANFAETKFYRDESAKSSYGGSTVYEADNQNIAPSLMFYLYHAKNIEKEEDLGTVVITLQALIPVNEIEYEIQLITISVKIDTKTYNDADAYDASITYSKKYEMPSVTDVNITNKSQFTAYFSLFAEPDPTDDIGFYGLNNDYHRSLVSSYVLPVGTKITMIDYGANEVNPNYYYYIVDEENYQYELQQLSEQGEASYNLSNFIYMDSVDKDYTYDDKANNSIYYHSDVNYIMEEFIFIFDFQDSNIEGEHLGNKLSFDLRNNEEREIITVLGIRDALMEYNLYESSNVALKEYLTMDSNLIYMDTAKDMLYDTSVAYNQTELRQSIIDTNYESSNMGMNITFYNISGTQVSSTLLSSTTITIDGTTYYVDANGVFRIKLSDKVSNLTRNLSLMTGAPLPTGTYTMRVVLFASSDGLHGSNALHDAVEEYQVIVIGSNNLIVSDVEEPSKLVLGETGLNMNGSNIENISIQYQSVLANPNIRLSIYKRDTSSFDSSNYIEIDSQDLFADTLTPITEPYITTNEYEYLITSSPTETINLSYQLKDELVSGTYRLVFRLYDDNQLIDEDYEYIIVRRDL